MTDCWGVWLFLLYLSKQRKQKYLFPLFVCPFKHSKVTWTPCYDGVHDILLNQIKKGKEEQKKGRENEEREGERQIFKWYGKQLSLSEYKGSIYYRKMKCSMVVSQWMAFKIFVTVRYMMWALNKPLLEDVDVPLTFSWGNKPKTWCYQTFPVSEKVHYV